jgi:hypothetical protein
MAEIPTHERPRERLLTSGVDALSERELLALVIRQGSRGENALDTAGSLLAEYGTLRTLGQARPEELAGHRGWGKRRLLGSSPRWRSDGGRDQWIRARDFSAQRTSGTLRVRFLLGNSVNTFWSLSATRRTGYVALNSLLWDRSTER